MTALMQDVAKPAHATPEYRQHNAAPKRLNHTPEEEKDSAQNEHIVYVETADDMTDEEWAMVEESRKQRTEHPEDSISLDDYMAQNGITEEYLARQAPVRFVYNI